MSFEINYGQLSEAGLKDLMLQKDPKALEEYNRRLNSSLTNIESVEEFQRLWCKWEFEGKQIQNSIDYSKLTVKQLRRLITLDVDKALDEYDRRIESGEIKQRKISFEEFEKIWNEREQTKRKAS